ncbi:SufE family protein [Nibricoccus sp. IMCC34717]|uniref:SufE family protein n=1 Tax=Nibricoccus sp. IMCC34717 TaxID=3034021 RepID=UPI00384F31C7
MSDLESRLREAIDELQLIPDVQERMAWVVDRAKRAPGLAAEHRTEANRVPGCVSAVWILHAVHDGRLRLQDDAESPLVRGLVHFVTGLFSDATPAEIVACELDPLAETGLLAGLSPTRQNGLQAVRARIRQWAKDAQSR